MTNLQDQQIRLRLEDITKEFTQHGGGGIVRAVDHVSLDIYDGEFVTLLGPSGCGKTTTLRLIAGFEIPTTGRMLLEGRDITSQPPNKRDMALVFQNYALFPHMTVFENVAYGLRTRGIAREQINQRANDVLSMMGLKGLEDRRPNQLSGGQQQRVALARSLVIEPRILLFDEPLSNLDAKLRVQMRSEIHRLHRRLGITSIYVTHDQIEAMALSDRIVVMNGGQIEQMGPPEEIYRRPATRFVAEFIGRANFVETVLGSVNGQTAEVPILGQNYRIPLHFSFKSGDAVVVLLRPEALSLSSDPELPQVRVEQAMYLGSEVEYIVRAGEQLFIVVEHDLRDGRIFAEGQMAGLTFPTESVHLLPPG